MDDSTRFTPTPEMDIFFSVAPDLLCIADFDGYFLRINPAWEKTLGFSTNELLSRKYIEFVHPDDRERTILEAELLTKRQATRSLENRYLCSDGTYKWLRWTYTSYPQTGRIYASARDVTELRQLRDELRSANQKLQQRVREGTQEWERSNQTLQSLIDACPHAIIAVDNDRNVRIWSDAARRIFGWTAQEVIGRPVPFVSDENRTESGMFNERALSGETFTNYEIQRTRRDGSPVQLLVSAAPMRDSSGVINGFLTVATDITEYKKLEQQFLRTQRLESLGTLASGIAHDLNNVLAPILMGLQLVRMETTAPGIQRNLDAMETCANRGADLVRQILTFARGVRGERSSIQAKHLLQDVHKVLSQTVPKSITISYDFPRDLWVIFADATQLHQVLMNVAINARDAMLEGGTLTLNARNVVVDEAYAAMNPGATTGPHVVFEIEDTGHGIPPEIKEKIFQPFFTTKAEGKGTGLGLSTVEAVVKSHHGFISLYSQVGRGTSFKIYFPAQPGQATQAAPMDSQTLPTGNGEWLLVVDDEVAVRDIARLILETHGYNVVVAQDGAEGVAMYARHSEKIQLVISDKDMPVMNGAAMIKALERLNPNVRVISASGLEGKTADDESRFRVTLAKPFTAEQLLKTVQKLLHAA